MKRLLRAIMLEANKAFAISIQKYMQKFIQVKLLK